MIFHLGTTFFRSVTNHAFDRRTDSFLVANASHAMDAER